MYDLRPMVAQFPHSLKYVHLLVVSETLPDAADSNIQTTLTNAVTTTQTTIRKHWKYAVN